MGPVAATSILPDDSVVVRLADRTVHVDATGRALVVRATWARADLGGSLVEAHPFSAVRRVRIRAGLAGAVAVQVELRSGRYVELGDSGTPEGARMTARAVADLCRCQLDAGGGEASVPMASARFSEADTFDDGLDFPTGPILVDRRAAQAALGVVPLEASPEPAASPVAPRPDPMDSRITREIVRVPKARPMASDLALPPEDDAPVFEALLRESQIAAALSPEGLQAALAPEITTPDDDFDHKPTVVGQARFEESAD